MKRKYISLIAIGLLIFSVAGIIYYAYEAGLNSDELIKILFYSIGALVLLLVGLFVYRKNPKISGSYGQIIYENSGMWQVFFLFFVLLLLITEITSIINEGKFSWMPLFLAALAIGIYLKFSYPQ
jgi:hypothetical protein